MQKIYWHIFSLNAKQLKKVVLTLNCHQNRITCIELCFMYLTFSANADSAFNTVVYHHTKTCFLLLIDCNLFTFYKKKCLDDYVGNILLYLFVCVFVGFFNKISLGRIV